jgi:predicted metal-dependent HD superfamily phosphohydrolase
MAEAPLTRWRNLWKRLGVDTPAVAGTGGAVLGSYEKMGRHYHNGAHLEDVLQKLDWAKEALEASGELEGLSLPEKQKLFDTIELALWYHDVVYDARRHDNEEKSRELFLAHAQEYGLPEDFQRAVAGLIDLTRHHKDAKTLPERILADCDLSILGAPPPEFERYDENIRKEYAHVPGPAYKRARREVLKGFLDQPEIFRTKAFRGAYEAAARGNLEKAVKPAVSWKWGGFRGKTH